MNNTYIRYIFFLLFLIWLSAFINYFLLKKKQKKLLQKIRESWGVAKDEYRKYELIEKFSILNTDKPFHTITQQTIADIDLQDLFAFIDRTQSKPGQQYLYNKLIKPTNDIAELERYNEQVVFFLQNASAQEDAQLLLLQLNHHNAYYITNILNNHFFENLNWSIFYKIDTAIVIAMLLLSIKFPVLLIWLMLPVALNIFLYFKNKSNIQKFNNLFPQINILINISKLFIKKDWPFDKSGIKNSIDCLKAFQKFFKILYFGEGKKNQSELAQIAFIISELIYAIFLIEIHSFYICINQLKSKTTDITNLFNYVGSIDTAISTASLRAGTDKYTTPVFIPHQKKMVAKNLYHPLIKKCVENSFNLCDKSMLITGSNMSGKSTFIRAIAINTILAQTIFTCFADDFFTPFLKVFSSIRISDSLLDDKSYYFEEVNTIGSLLKEAEKSFQHLFILDEVFKGTNTIERVAAAKAILSYLNKNNNIVFVSTHDIELVELLKLEFDLYHFTENIENEKLVFDHLLKMGALKTRNAIKLMALSNYPKEIIEEANSIANKN